MLTLTENASNVVKKITAQTPGADGGGLRISTSDAASHDLTVAVLPAPQPQDEVVESAGALVFLEENAAVALSDKVLDAEVDEAGAVRFALRVAG